MIKPCVMCESSFNAKGSDNTCSEVCQTERRLFIKREEYRRNRETHLKAKAAYQASHPEVRRKKYGNYAKNHPGAMAAKASLRRARKLLATPKWLTPEHLRQINEFYVNCPTSHHVDHIIPLKSKGVCGLHVPWNLQYLPAHENIVKGNRLEIYHR